MPYSPETMAGLVLVHPRIPKGLHDKVISKMAKRTTATTRHRAKGDVPMGISAACTEALRAWVEKIEPVPK